MKFIETTLPGLYLIEPYRIDDSRGFFSEIFREDFLKEQGIPLHFVQENAVYSSQTGVLRGLHYQSPPHAQAKLVRVSRGAIWDIVVDIRIGSPTYGQWLGFELSPENHRQLLIPVGFAHGYVTLKPETEVIYKVSDYYAPQTNKGVLWNDPELNIDWKLAGRNPVISPNDHTHPSFNQLDSEFTFQP